MVQYLRGEIGVPPVGFPEPLRSKVLKYRKIDLVEGRPGDELGEYKFDKAAEELRSKYGSSKISDKDVLVNWKDYEAVYGDVEHQLPTNLFLILMNEGGGWR